MLSYYAGLAVLALQAGAVVTGQTSCNSYMCITGLHDSTTNTDTFTLAPPTGATLPRSQVGYMAIGFGTQMGGSPMVIGWPTSDGSIILSQRQSSGRNPPQVVASPPRSASLLTSQSFSNTTSTSITFTLPSNSDSTSNATSVIWAYGTDNPGSSASASLRQHTGHGVISMALMTPIQAAATTGGTTGGTGSSATPVPTAVTVSDQSSANAESRRLNIILTHAILGAIPAMLFVPLGVITPRLGRGWTTSRWWFPVHGVLGVLAATTVIASFAYGTAQFAGGYASTHRGLGLAFFVLILVQILLGAAVHWIRPRKAASKGRGPTNYIHVALGLAVMAVGFATVYTGMSYEYPMYTGRVVGNGWIAGWAVVVAVAGVAWLAGLALLPKQLRNESAGRGVDSDSLEAAGTYQDKRGVERPQMSE